MTTAGHRHIRSYPDHHVWSYALTWRRIDHDQRNWTGLVDYSRDGLLYSHWLNGDLIELTTCSDPGTTWTPGSTES